jgi:hypothetical protein
MLVAALDQKGTHYTLFKKIIAVYSQTHTQSINTKSSVKHVVKIAGTYNYH